MEVGSRLREARLARRLELSEVARELGVPVEQLRALEADRFDVLPEYCAPRKLLGGYAAFLGLDPESFLSAYDVRAGDRESGANAKDHWGVLRARRFRVLAALVLVGVVAAWASGAIPLPGDEKAGVDPEPASAVSPSSPEESSSDAAGAAAGAGQSDDSSVGASAAVAPAGTVVLAAGDIAECDHEGDEATAALLERYPDASIATLGDNAYQHGTFDEFEQCYDPSWGKFKDRTRPATGNHDHSTKDGRGYYDYFGDGGGPFDKYYYSYEVGDWHVVVLNSDCWRIGGCDARDPQLKWLRKDIKRHPAPCTLAYWHRPPFSSGRYGDESETKRVRPMWEQAVELGVDVVLVGHEHSYERFAPMDAQGDRDEENGVQLIIAGTGGGNLREYKNPPLPTTQVRNDNTWGVLKLTLHPTSYEWEFLPVAGKTFTDRGSGQCQ